MSTGTRKWSDLAEGERTLALALALSAGLHLIVMLTLSLAPGGWRHGFQPALRVVLKEPPMALPESMPTAPAAAIAPVPEAPEKKPENVQGKGHSAPVASPGASLPIAERYYRSSEVDEPAVPLERGPLVFPEDAYVWKLAGLVRARVYIGAGGEVESVYIEEVQPRTGIFEQAALEALRQVRYRPAMIAGAAVKSQKLIEVKFDPYEESHAR